MTRPSPQGAPRGELKGVSALGTLHKEAPAWVVLGGPVVTRRNTDIKKSRLGKKDLTCEHV